MSDCEAVQDARSAVIHDEADLTIFFDGDFFTASLILRNGVKLSSFAKIINGYGLLIEEAVVTDLPFVTLHLRETGPDETVISLKGIA